MALINLIIQRQCHVGLAQFCNILRRVAELVFLTARLTQGSKVIGSVFALIGVEEDDHIRVSLLAVE